MNEEKDWSNYGDGSNDSYWPGDEWKQVGEPSRDCDLPVDDDEEFLDEYDEEGLLKSSYKAYGFEGANYSEVVSFESGKGYYVYSVNNCSYEVAAHEAIVEMNDGWNLVNLPKGNLKENFPGATIAWSWDGSKYDRADDLISPTAAFVYWSEK